MHRFLVFVTLVSTVLGGTLQIIDHQGQCFVYSTHNFGCTGVSEPFAPLDGVSCSSLNKANNSTQSDPPSFKAMLCGSSQHPAWVEVYRSGLLYFHNYQGDEGSCKINGDLVKGSLCTVRNSSQTSSPENQSQPTSPVATSSPASVMAAVSTPKISSDSESPSNSVTDC
ncbi:hypothetical protein N7481_008475 [Penicillium waksmanii]|uniref:uncharacterized protein n=1 Tax=Penicillium waksmanii TaxID=69791 RepID=UPI002549A6FF|nr:uncharacterized protein N7481_008475 [Penicillium waksmanii]KAJ5974768.1 hypothetical protein N7481_008475 [Penicillium waksmanii]